MELSFSKLHGLGNDFVVIDDFQNELELSVAQVQHLCDRHFGIGADGVILVRPSQRPECVAYMHYINSDGTLAEMCGNGIRCFAKFLVDHSYVDASVGSFMADTKRGPLTLSFSCTSDGLLDQVTVDMDEPIFKNELIPTTLSQTTSSYIDREGVFEQTLSSPWGDFAFTCVSMGNPHAVCFLDDIKSLPDDCFASHDKSLDTFNLDAIGSYFESHKVFPAKSNIEFIVTKEDGLHMRVFERGCGETLACGTGACASLVAAVATGRSARHNMLHLRGGSLDIDWKDNNHVFMSGPAAQAFTGSVEV